MAKKTKADDRTPSADEIIEALSLEMGVSEDEDGDDAAEAPAEKSEAREEKAEASADEEEAAPKKKSSSNDAMAAMGGIFDVPSSGSKKKKKKPEPKAAPKEEASSPAMKASSAKESSGGAGAEEPRKKKKKAGVDAIDNLFELGGGSGPDPVDTDPLDALDEDRDLEKFEKRAGGKSNTMMYAIIGFLVLALGATVIFMGGYGDDIISVFDGTYRDKKDAEKRRIEEEFRKAELEKLEKYGNLNITGTQHALFRIKLPGDSAPKPLYGRIGESNLYRPLRLPVIVQNLKIKQPISITIEAPNYQSQPLTLTKDIWQESALFEYQYQTNIHLQPASAWHQQELNDRMLPFEDEENIPKGVIKVESTPPGAKIMINKRLVVDKEGNPVLTPATIAEVPAREAKEDDKKKPEPQPLDINTPPDVGYRIDVFFDNNAEPMFVDVVQRSMWTCELKDEKEISRLAKDARPALKCDYTAKVEANFNELKAEIQRQKAVEEEMKKQAEERLKIDEDAKKKAEGGE